MGLLAPALLAVCGGSSPLATGFERELAPAGGCGDVYLVAGSSDGRTALVFRADDAPLATLGGGGGPISYDLASTGTLYVEQGSQVVASVCAFEPIPGAQVDRRYHATAGSASLRHAAGPPAAVTLELTGVTLHEELGSHELGMGDVSLVFPDSTIDLPSTMADAGVGDAG